MILGSAVPTTVWSSAARKTATMTAYSTRIRTGWGSSMGGRSAAPPHACVVGLDTWSTSLLVRLNESSLRDD
jgi:hypothetical protein